jgi:methionyl-tRNA formyltransferase
VHRMNPRIDAGEILYQVRVRTRLDDTVASLYERIMARSVGLMTPLVRDAWGDRLVGRPQEESSSSYYSSTTAEDFHIRFAMPAEVIARRAAATPGRCWFLLQGRRIHVAEGALESRRAEEPGQSGQGRAASPVPGAVLSLGRRHAVVAANPGRVRLRRLAEGAGPELPAAALLRRAGLGPGYRLEE